MRQSVEVYGRIYRRNSPGKTPCRPSNLPVHQSSALSVLSTTSILSPTLKSRSPSACAAKSYSATTYCTAGFGFDFNGGGGGGARLAAAAAAAAVPFVDGEYGGGAAGAGGEDGGTGDFALKLEEDEGGGGGAFFWKEPEAGGGTREEVVEVEVVRPSWEELPEVRRCCWTILPVVRGLDGSVRGT